MQKNQVFERRKYIRLDSVFPVEIYLPDRRSGTAARMIQAFTCDVSLGGLCLSVNDPVKSLLDIVTASGSSIDIDINIPLAGKPAAARVRIAWHEIKQLEHHRQLLIGVSYEEISLRDRRRIFNTARYMKWLPRVAVFSSVILLCLLIFSNYRIMELRKKNQELIKRFYEVQAEGELYRRSATNIEEKYSDLKGRLANNEKTLASLEAKLAVLKFGDPNRLAKEKVSIDENIAAALDEKALLESQLKGIEGRMEKASKLLDEVKGKRRVLDEATAANMYQWLKTHRNHFTGLVMSFEGDPAVKDWAFIYDQSLVSQIFLISEDKKEASQILSFFKDKAARRSGAFMNAYNAATGAPAEDTVRLGPNIWIGIAAVRYAERTNDNSYLDLAEETARWVISQKDKEGGVRGGPDVAWYSTEHNLDAYALFKMLHQITKKEIYRQEMISTFNWIKNNTYSPSEGRLNRGKGDSTIATDTLAWAIAAIGPAVLSREGMNPDDIMKFAEEHCLVSTHFNRPDGQTVNIKGFDFAKSRNIARSGIVSTEWTAQMIISYRIMSDYYKGLGDRAKAEGYLNKAELYMGELDKMVISSPSPSGQGAGCLPYASQPSADTGHGWRTPAGAQTGSVSGTTYALFAKRGYNPLSLD